MAKFIIEGKQKLSGEIEVYGAKNAAIKMIAGACLFSGKTVLENVPDILDIQKIITILEFFGVRFLRNGHTLEIDTSNMTLGDPDPKLVGEIRASIVLVGPLLSRFGKVKIPHPGGCMIGSRPIDLHIKAFKDLSVKVIENNKFYQFEAPVNLSENKTSQVNFKKISVTGTENILLYASNLENQDTIITNAAIEPEVIDLIKFLKTAGAEIAVSKREISIKGKKNLSPVRYRVMPDRIEAGTFAILAAATKSDLKILNLVPNHLESLLDKFKIMGIQFEINDNSLYIKTSPDFQAISINTGEYPDFPTDLQPPMGILLTQAQGRSMIKENIFDHRLEYLKQLEKMGAKIDLIDTKQAEITGPAKLSGIKLDSLDLRAGATLLIAGLVASGTTEINNAENIDRGYEKIEDRLKRIGAKIKRVL